ncbi:ATP-binding protein [Coprobacillaceae bacterium CR2/5/TPMF4]|nr:ATP-binding protein [Coprobacillaceae bacterium CR2/5/TPMF4]
MIHGYQNNAKCNVVIKVTIENNRQIKIIIQDYGKGIEDIDQARKPMYSSLKELEHAGMGLTIIEALCDDLEIHSTVDLGTKLTIKKNLKDNNFND